MAEVRVQARFTLAPASAENVAVNTFHFVSTGVDFEDADTSALDQVQAFYTAAPPGLSAALGQWMGVKVARAAELRAYDMSLPPYARIPVIRAITLPAAFTAADRTPLEVSACLSYRAAAPFTRRRRGRIYLPGVTTDWFDPASTTAAPMFTVGAGTGLDVLRRAGQQLVQNTLVGDWSVRSMATGVAQYATIVDGYVDRDPDTQRRRGLQDSGREPWGALTP